MKIYVLVLIGIMCAKNGCNAPDFLLIGVQKAGTSSLYAAITQHPKILAARSKELHFFNWHFNKGLGWYLKWFPNFSSRRKNTGEATPNYLYTKEAPERVFTYFPSIKLIVVLRDPVERAISQYKHAVSLGLEKRSFQKCVQYELAALQNGETPKHNVQSPQPYPRHPIFGHPNFASSLNSEYIESGIYVKHMKNWLKWFNRKQLLILRFQDLIQNPQQTFNKIFNFLGVRPYHRIRLPHLNTTHKQITIEPEAIKMLQEFYQPYNKELEIYLGMKFNWLYPAQTIR